MKKLKSENLLDFTPVHSPACPWEQRENGRVIVRLCHSGGWNRLAQRLFQKPASSRIELDELGSFVWLQMDGSRTVFALARLVEEQFGESAEPLYNRICAFLGILRDHGMIRLEHKIPA